MTRTKEPSEYIHQYVKLSFEEIDTGNREEMWVFIERLGTGGTDLKGFLLDNPTLNVGYVSEDDVEFDVSQICEVNPSEGYYDAIQITS